MNIRNKFVLILSLVLMISLISGFYTLSTYRDAAQRSAEIRDVTSRIVNASLSAQVHFKKQVQEWKNVLIRGREIDLYNKYLGQFFDEERQTREYMQELISLLDDNAEARSTAQSFLTAHKSLGGQYRAALKLYDRNKTEPHMDVDLKVRGIDREPTDLLDEVVVNTQRHKEIQLAIIGSEVEQSERRVLLIIVAIALLLIMVVYFLTDRMIARRILAATAVANRISRGDLSSGIKVDGQDEAAQLLRALQTMQANLGESQRTLKESEQHNRLLLNSTGEGIYGLNRDGLCIFINPAGAHSLGYADPSDLVGRKIHDLIHHSHADGSTMPVGECRAAQTYISGKRADVDDEVFWRPDGTCFPVEYHSYPIYQESRLIGAVVSFADITKRRKSERELQQAHDQLREERSLLAQRVDERTEELNMANAELEKSAKAKDAFLASMSHELRTPLTTIIGLTEFLSDQLYGPLNENQDKALDTIFESSQHLLALINDVLDVAKVEAGKMELHLDEVPVQQLAESSLRMIRQQAQKKGLQVTYEIDPAVRILWCDPRRIKQVLINLLGNAVKFTPERGKISLEILGNKDLDEVLFRVRDNGIGIPEAELGQLFRPFVQVGDTVARQDGGTGLGLALVYRMAQLHGGRVDVESTPGEGSLFTVHLPWNRLSEESLTVQDSGENDVGAISFPEGASILIAEDNPTIQKLLSEYMEKHGLQVLIAGDGESALSVARERQPDLILMDVQLPIMDGLETVDHLRKDPDLQRTVVIALTALAMPGDRERCLEAGMDDYISKPVGMRELMLVIASHINRAQRHH